MPSAARITDLWVGICCCHSHPTCVSMTGHIITGSPNVIDLSQKQARLTDMTIGECGHTGRIVSGTPVVIANGLQKAIITRCLPTILLILLH